MLNQCCVSESVALPGSMDSEVYVCPRFGVIAPLFRRIGLVAFHYAIEKTMPTCAQRILNHVFGIYHGRALQESLEGKYEIVRMPRTDLGAVEQVKLFLRVIHS